jgi:gliding motility-associated-like protein
MKKYYKHFAKFIYALCFVLFLIGNTSAQKEANIWYFGHWAGIDFNGSAPVALTDGKMIAGDGCASIADSNGNLLFYTDGVSIWNKNHLKMPNGNGLMGHNNATQSSVIVPQPGNDSIFYVFTIAYAGQPNGFCYSRVNMNLAVGLGDVETSTKNTPLLTPVTEKITATRHANGKYIWVIVHGWNSNNFHAYLVTDAGLDTTPVVSSTGLYLGGNTDNTKGQLKSSIDGSKIVICIQGLNKVQLFDFNISTGMVSNPVTFPNHHNNYGCEFSPDISKLYISQSDSGSIYQYDISSNDSATMVTTGVLIAPLYSARFSSLQLAPDGKIYIATVRRTTLSTIEKPNEAGLGCVFKLNGFNLSSRRSNLGLPNFIVNHVYNAEFEVRNLCFSDETCFKYTGLGHFDSLVWNFDDGSGLKATNEKNICYQYADTGTYDVKLVRWHLGKTDTTVRTFVINPQIYSSLSVSICEGDSIFLQGKFRKETGVYFDTLFNGSNQGCDSIVETILTVSPKVNEIVNISICTGDSVFLGGEFQKFSGDYYDTIFNGNSDGCDSIIKTTLEVNPISVNDFVDSICRGDSLYLAGAFQTEEGVYYDTIYGGNSLGCDSIIITTLKITSLMTSNQFIEICQGDSVLINGEFHSISGDYYDTIYLGSSLGCDSIIITTLKVKPVAINTLDIYICKGDSMFLGGKLQTEEGVYYDTLFNGSYNGCDSVVITNLFHTIPDIEIQTFHECEGFSIAVESNTYTKSGIYKDIVNGCDTIITQLNIYDTPVFSFSQIEDTCNQSKGSVSGKVISGTLPYSYFWNNGSTDSVISDLKSGFFSLTVVDSNGCLSADTVEVMNLNIDCDLFFYVPGAFSPNGDGSNDVFRVSNKHLSKINVQIFNRWGEEIFRSADVNFAWDGTYKGQFCPDGIYTVIIHYETHLESGKTYLYKGNLHLLR